MRPACVIVFLWAGVAAGAAVPRDPPPDPLARGYLGVTMSLNSLTVDTVDDGTPAALAGMRPGDVMVQIGPLRPQAFSEVIQLVAGLRPGTHVRVTVRRGGETLPLLIRLGVRPERLGPPAGEP